MRKLTKSNSDKIRVRTNFFIEPYLKSLCAKNKQNITMSKYMRYAIINQLIRDGVKLNGKYAPFVKRTKLTT